ncbi:hypothetical protein [Pedobacter borealis]|uniref:hypothetical protein n=1 Tax=Pedobacter borealis TaxID=475254 RepID=UPI00049351E6|nr:hypothetical protein [Pedobacter borealis]
MLKQDYIIAQYEANKVSGRGFYCPSKGVYKIMRVKQGKCYGKPSLMAIALWKPSIDDSYELTTRFEIQLESVKQNAKGDQVALMETSEILYREIIVTAGSYSIGEPFILTFEILEKVVMTLDEIDFCFGGCGFNSDDDDPEKYYAHKCAISEEYELIEYANALLANGLDYVEEIQDLLEENEDILLLEAIDRLNEY